ncbi:hypothetical protein KP509_16G042000 [Ceratopteris richardii]|uniref:Uncharacterized protein n=1 Tax=Ceratopteris richardii TaxID=49495 RepID=A0A8T2T405_CERRI|nr:hypothetical protein KP509_16G042000 [Ceratopteris richardii]
MSCFCFFVFSGAMALLIMLLNAGNEICEKLGAIGLSANMIMYLTQVLHMDYVQAVNILTNFGGTSSLTPLIGAFLADAYVGRFWIIGVGSVIFSLGALSLTISAVVPSLQPISCTSSCPPPSQKELTVVILGLILLSVGSGGIRPCVAAFGADQLPNSLHSNSKRHEEDEFKDDKHPLFQSSWSFFNWYYFVIGVSSLLAITIIVYIQDNLGWGVGFGIPAGLMVFSVISFFAGAHLYVKLPPMGSPLTRVSRVLVAAFRKRRISAFDYTGPLYELTDKQSISVQQIRLHHTQQFNFLDRAAIEVPEDRRDDGSFNPWRLCTVTEVEELKLLFRMAPIWASGIVLVTASVQQHTFSVLQARTLDRHVFPRSSFEIPPGSMAVFSIASMLFTISLYDRLLMPLASKVTRHPRGITCLQRMGVGFVISTLATAISAVIELKRKQAAASAGAVDMRTVIPMSMYYLLPQYCLHGVAEAFMSIGHLEFLYGQAPESMRSTATAFFWICISAGSYLSSAIVSLVHHNTEWLPKNLNHGHLEYFYCLLTVLQVLNFLVYCISARWYKYKIVLDQEETDMKDRPSHSPQN